MTADLHDAGERGGPGVFREERAGRGAETGNAERDGRAVGTIDGERGGRGALRGMEGRAVRVPGDDAGFDHAPVAALV